MSTDQPSKVAQLDTAHSLKQSKSSPTDLQRESSPIEHSPSADQHDSEQASRITPTKPTPRRSHSVLGRIPLSPNSTAAVFDVASSSSSTAYIALPTPEAVQIDLSSKGLVASFVQRNLGLFLIATAQLFFATMNLCAKLLTTADPPIHPLEIIFVRMAVTWVGSLAYLHINRIPGAPFGPKAVRLLLVARGLFGFFVLFGMYYSLQYLALSDATVLSFLSPILTGYFGRIFLNEVFLKMELYAGLMSFVGVILVAHPESLFGGSTISGATPLQRLSAVGASVMGAIGAAAAYITIRAIGSRAHPLISVSLFALYSSLVSGFGVVVLHQPFIVPQSLTGWVEWVVVGLSGFVGQFLLTSGLQIERAGRGVSMVYLQMFFAFAFEL
jgi:drug/metabolite transporter (DMT)-like permease